MLPSVADWSEDCKRSSVAASIIAFALIFISKKLPVSFKDRVSNTQLLSPPEATSAKFPFFCSQTCSGFNQYSGPAHERSIEGFASQLDWKTRFSSSVKLAQEKQKKCISK